MREFRAEFSDILGLGEAEISRQSVPLPDLWLPPVEDPWEWVDCDRAAADVWAQMHELEPEPVPEPMPEPEPQPEPQPDQHAGSEQIDETYAYSPQGTAREGYEPLDSSIAERVMARHRDLETEQSYSPGGTADAYEPLTVGARVHARHEASYVACISHALSIDATAGGAAVTATACACDDDDEMICMF